MNPIKVGLIGFGRMGGFYLEEMQKSGNWDIVYICDVSPASRELAQRLSPRSKVISDEQIIFNDPEIQVFGLFDRRNLEWRYPLVKDALISASNGEYTVDGLKSDTAILDELKKDIAQSKNSSAE